ncbi:N-acetylneuraminate synthase [Nitratidesulfovibrio vulgaris]|uniref:N-acetylneuraminate synthase n=1 Tax=Nitratidesulfovibrio vulgaris (strain DP4) TaxID=391774 RepID=A0A0H3AB92_NITV4|nr:N-acetylneuraminate synthase [Nitratidesulfovibrio vulgaris]ABM29605.1 N-acetylneuraminate synthase [Nitratidesulfovibrio vulgaris DP4]
MNENQQHALIVAEAGVNHNGDINLAHKLIDVAAEAGADIVKFQTFHAESVISACAPKAAYQQKNTGTEESQLDMVRKLELPAEDFHALNKHCDERGIVFWSTAFDLASVEFLHNLGLKLWKIPSGEITNLPYLRKIGQYQAEIVLSTGMATLGDIETALNILEHAGTLRKNVTVLHCTTEYPAPLESVNLRAMQTIRNAFPGIHGVGYSDHTEGIEIALAAVAMGARLIEKHFTLDKQMEGPDHKASLDPRELRTLVTGVRHVLAALGNGIKHPTNIEMQNRIVARKSLVCSAPICKGDILGKHNMTVKRPGSGISALRWDEYCGRKAERNYDVDELI